MIELFWNIVIHLTPATNVFIRGISLGPSLVNWKLNQDIPKLNVKMKQIFFSWDIGKIESWKSGNIWTGQNPELTCIGLDWGYAERGRNLCSILYYLAKKNILISTSPKMQLDFDDLKSFWWFKIFDGPKVVWSVIVEWLDFMFDDSKHVDDQKVFEMQNSV